MRDHKYLYDEGDEDRQIGPDWSELEEDMGFDEGDEEYPEDDEEYLEWLKSTGGEG